jgi:protocatechuate 3,4-dioxygenase beta subunit
MIGRVVDENGNGVAGATVAPADLTMLPADSPKSVTTDEKGCFELPRLVSGRVRLLVSTPDRKTAEQEADSDAVDVLVKMRPATEPIKLSAIVVDAEGKACPNVQVTLNRVFEQGKDTRVDKMKARTDAKGVASFTLPAPAVKSKGELSRVLSCDVPGQDLVFAPARMGGDAEVRMQLCKSEPVTGKVVDAEGKPIAGAVVQITGINQQKDSSSFVQISQIMKKTATTDAEGRFVLERIGKSNAVDATVSAAGYASENSFADPKKPDADRVIRLERGCNIRGKVVDKNGKPVPGMPISNQFGFSTSYFNTDDKGCFEVTGMKPGSCKLAVRLSGDPKLPYAGMGLQTVFLDGGQTADAVLEVEEGTPVSGRIIDKKTGKAPTGQVGTMVKGLGQLPLKDDMTWKAWFREGIYEVYVSIDGDWCEPVKLTVEKGKPIENFVVEAEMPNR